MLGLCGLLGSGRTELALSLFGITHPDSGELFIEDKPVKLKTTPTPLSVALVMSLKTA